MFNKKILIDLDCVLNEYGKEKFNENFIRVIIVKLLMKLRTLKCIGNKHL